MATIDIVNFIFVPVPNSEICTTASPLNHYETLTSAPLTLANAIYVWQEREVEGTLWTEIGSIKILVD